MTEKELSEIAQLSFYMSQENETFDSIIEKDANYKSKPDYTTHDFKVSGSSCRLHYYKTTAPKSNPPWLNFVNEKLPIDKKISFQTMSNNPNGLLLIRIKNRIFAATFGRSSSSCLDFRKFESDFGIKAAMNLCGNEEVRQTKTQSHTMTPTQIDRQTAKPSEAFAFGLSEAEDLKFISAHIKGDANITLQGRENLTVKFAGTEKLVWSNLVAACENYHRAYNGEEYISLFPNYKNFKPASPSDSKKLDEELIEALKNEDFSKIYLAIPEFLSEDEYGFSYTDNPKKENKIYAYLDARQLRDQLKLDKLDIQHLKRRKVWAYSPVDDRVLSYRKWYLYDCLNFEHQLDNKYFVLSDGKWRQIDNDFYASITNFSENILKVEPCEDIFKGINISNNESKKNEERIFNDRVCEIRPSVVKFDRAKLKIGNGRKDKEFCDILDLQDDGTMRIINCKPLKDASSINYLFSQAKFYSEAFLSDEIFLKEIRGHISLSTSPRKNKYLEYIKDKLAELHGQHYRVCLWLLYDQTQQTPTVSELPLISRYELKLAHDHLTKILKFNDVFLRFVPVQITNYVTAKAPKAKNAAKKTQV